VKLRVDPDGRGIWLGDQHVPWAEVRVEDAVLGEGPDAFEHRSRHAWIPLENGYRVSVTWGTGTYGSNYSLLDVLGPGEREWIEEPTEVEVAIVRMDDDGLVVLTYHADEGDDSVMGWVGIEELVDIIAKVATWPSGLTEAPIPRVVTDE